MDGGEDPSASSPSPPEDLNTSLLGRIRRVGGLWLGGGSAMAPPPAEDANSSLLSATTVKRRGRPPKIPTTPTIDLKNLLRGDESPGPSTLGPSHLAVTAPRPRRKSASPSSSSDANSAATNWLLETFIVSEDPSTAIHKSRIWDRYTEFCEESGTVPLVDAVLGKRVKECFPSVKTRRSNLQNAYIGITVAPP
ncbi:DNA-binding protein RFX7 [Folsomia candida]|uniref:DNA-binding protein RFX7 n=1 Tax=Folsomia candida TaxID=158441 RepID=A0A226DC71_FOLCA|nr:DNA-binding protein RFX7 [Folsomia candida]